MNDIGARIYYDDMDGEYEVWVAPSGDLEGMNVINAFVAGIGATRDEAVADAVRELESLAARLQARPDAVLSRGPDSERTTEGWLREQAF